jgi:excisionase family DNA binding protein
MLVSTHEVARRLGVDPSTIKRMCRAKEIPTARVNGNGRYLIDDAILNNIKINPRGWQKGKPRKEK